MACPYHPFRTVFAFQKLSQKKFSGSTWKKFFQFICGAVESVQGYWEMLLVNIWWLMSRFKAYWSEWNITASFRNLAGIAQRMKIKRKFKTSLKKKIPNTICTLPVFWLGNRLGFNSELEHWILAKNTMQFGTPAKLGQHWGSQSQPCLLSQRPLPAANGAKRGQEGKMQSQGERNIAQSSREHRDTQSIPSDRRAQRVGRGGEKLKSGVKQQSSGSEDTRVINTHRFRIPLLLKESWELHQPELGRTNGSALPRRDWGSWSWCGLKAWNRANTWVKRLTLPLFIPSPLSIIGNYACNPWIFILILASN